MKIKIWLIRHGMTAGNRQQRYVGTTDELLCEEGRQQIILKRQLIKSGNGRNSVSGGQSDNRSGFSGVQFRRI